MPKIFIDNVLKQPSQIYAGASNEDYGLIRNNMGADVYVSYLDNFILKQGQCVKAGNVETAFKYEFHPLYESVKLDRFLECAENCGEQCYAFNIFKSEGSYGCGIWYDSNPYVKTIAKTDSYCLIKNDPVEQSDKDQFKSMMEQAELNGSRDFQLSFSYYNIFTEDQFILGLIEYGDF